MHLWEVLQLDLYESLLLEDSMSRAEELRILKQQIDQDLKAWSKSRAPKKVVSSLSPLERLKTILRKKKLQNK